MSENKLSKSVIDLYISEFPEDVRIKLNQLKDLILEVVPDAVEKFSYQMPTFYYYRNLIHFAVNKNHIGLYPGSTGVSYFLTLTDKYPTSKGAIRIDISEELPLDLIRKLVEYRKEENIEKYSKK
jgi:uncharacterized protein YdhG (YjbR/CyaY superfamily)